MSKTDSSLRLLAILRFSVPSNSSRTLNATQAYDVTSSGITLASAIGKLVDKSVAVKAGVLKPQEVSMGLTLTGAGANLQGDTVGAGKQNADVEILSSNATLAVVPAAKARQSANKCTICGDGKCCPGAKGTATTLDFIGTGNTTGDVIAYGLSNKSKATNPNTTFYGGIPVATGDYKKWQGKYAVLKINTVTGKGVLRIYDA